MILPSPPILIGIGGVALAGLLYWLLTPSAPSPAPPSTPKLMPIGGPGAATALINAAKGWPVGSLQYNRLMAAAAAYGAPAQAGVAHLAHMAVAQAGATLWSA